MDVLLELCVACFPGLCAVVGTSLGRGAATSIPPVLCLFSDISCAPAPYRLSLISSLLVITEEPVLSRRSWRRSFSCHDSLRAEALCCFSAALGWSRSGDSARLNRGDPGSQLFGRAIAFLAVGVSVWWPPGLGLPCDGL